MWPAHVLRSGVVLDELRLVYVPVPKAGSTSVLWTVADLAGIPQEVFTRSVKLEMTRALTVHDPLAWGKHRILEGRSLEEQRDILAGPNWMRFTVVRDPVRRIWSSWVGKVLCRDPRFTRVYGEEDWFPPVPQSSEDVLTSFRQFVQAVAATSDERRDPHWASQFSLVGMGIVSYAHVGRVEQFDETARFLSDYLAERGVPLPPLRRENAALLPWDAGVVDAATAAACDRATEIDSNGLGYRPSQRSDEPPLAWHAAVEAALPALGAVIERNERIADLRDRARGSEQLRQGRLAS